MSERLKHLGQMQEAQLHAKALRLKIEGLLCSVRYILDPTMKPEDLNLAQADLQMDEMVAAQGELFATVAHIDKINRALNG